MSSDFRSLGFASGLLRCLDQQVRIHGLRLWCFSQVKEAYQGVLSIGEAWGTRGKTAILVGFVVLGSETCMGGRQVNTPKAVSPFRSHCASRAALET